MSLHILTWLFTSCSFDLQLGQIHPLTWNWRVS